MPGSSAFPLQTWLRRDRVEAEKNLVVTVQPGSLCGPTARPNSPTVCCILKPWKACFDETLTQSPIQFLALLRRATSAPPLFFLLFSLDEVLRYFLHAISVLPTTLHVILV